MEHSCKYQSGKTEELGAEGKEGEQWQLDSMAVEVRWVGGFAPIFGYFPVPSLLSKLAERSWMD